MKNHKSIRTGIMMLLLASLVLFPSCASAAFEIDNLPVDWNKVRELEILTPGRNVRTVTDVEVKTADEAGVFGWIRGWDMKGDKLTIKLGGDLTVLLPHDNNVEDIEVSIAAGSVLVKDLDTLDRLDASSAAGSLKAENINDLKAARFDSASGDITFENVNGGKISGNTVSGRQYFSGNVEELGFSGVTGMMEVNVGTEADITFKTTGGSMYVTMAAEAADVSYDRLTGRGNYIHDPFSKVKVTAKAMTGNLTIETR